MQFHRIFGAEFLIIQHSLKYEYERIQHEKNTNIAFNLQWGKVP
jgi:hypothetical protein